MIILWARPQPEAAPLPLSAASGRRNLPRKSLLPAARRFTVYNGTTLIVIRFIKFRVRLDTKNTQSLKGPIRQLQVASTRELSALATQQLGYHQGLGGASHVLIDQTELGPLAD
jgi:hypothetical protein